MSFPTPPWGRFGPRSGSATIRLMMVRAAPAYMSLTAFSTEGGAVGRWDSGI